MTDKTPATEADGLTLEQSLSLTPDDMLMVARLDNTIPFPPLPEPPLVSERVAREVRLNVEAWGHAIEAQARTEAMPKAECDEHVRMAYEDGKRDARTEALDVGVLAQATLNVKMSDWVGMQNARGGTVAWAEAVAAEYQRILAAKETSDD